MPSATVKEFDLKFILESEDESVLRRLTSIATRLGIKRSRYLVTGLLLASSSQEPLYLWFHVDKESAPGKGFFCHLEFQEKPSSSPPDDVVKAFESGCTAEWLIGELMALAKKPLVVLADAQLTVESWPRKKTTLIMAAPIGVEDSVLELVGAEYKTKQRKPGVKRFRWKAIEEGKLRVWLSYSFTIANEPFNPLTQERERCRNYLTDLL